MVNVEKIVKKECFFPIYNHELQLRIVQRAIEQLLFLQSESDKDIAVYNGEPSGECEGSHYEDVFYDSCYTPVIVSQSIISLMASFLEGAFRHEAESFCTIVNGEVPKGKHHRCKLGKNLFWDVSIRSEKGEASDKNNIVIGIWQILKSLQVEKHFENNFHMMTKLIFEYRNFSMHNGFEWDQEKRQQFKVSLGKQFTHYEDYFSWSTSGDEIWMVAMSKEFIEILLLFSKQVVESFEKAREQIINTIIENANVS